MTEQTSSLAAALVAAQAEMPKVEPDAVNPHFKSKFVSLDHLIAKTRPVLNKHGLAITQSPTVSANGDPQLTTKILHVSGEALVSTMQLLVAKNDMQGLGGAITYARRYAWAAALGICADEDDDGNQASVAQGPSRAPETARAATATAARAPSPPATANEKTAEPTTRDLLVTRLEELGVEWKTLKPEWDDGELVKWFGKKARTEGELRAAIATYESNIAVAKSPFQIPTAPGEKAA